MLGDTQTRRDLCSLSACAAFVLAFAGTTHAFPMQDAVAAAGTAETAPAAEQGESLRAVFIDVSGVVQWRENDSSPWQAAKVNDVVSAGVEIRTAMRARAALRVGMNATLLLDGGTALTLPAVVREGEILRTVAAVKSGRADFKVDRVGLANDFRVVTPSTTLAVKGTEFAVMVGPLKQMEIVGARRNMINAIELRYALNNKFVSLSGAAQSSAGVKDPAHAAMMNTAAPTVGGTPQTNERERVENAAKGPAPVESGSTGFAALANKATARSAKQSGEAEASVGATIRRSIELANARTERALQYLEHASDYGDLAEAQSDILASLKQLADARRDEALAMLAQHQASLAATNAAHYDSMQASASFNALAGDLSAHLGQFAEQRDSANELLGKIESAIAGQGEGDLRTLAQQATDALMGMNTALEGAHGSLNDMGARLAEVERLLGDVGSNHAPAAAAAIASYQQSMAQLQALAAAGGSAQQIAAAANAAVANLNVLVQYFAGMAQTQEALAAAAQALSEVAAAQAALAQSQNALASIQQALAASGAAGNAGNLGMVAQLYEQIVAIRAAMAQNMLVAAGLVEGADHDADGSNGYAESVFTMLGDYWRGIAYEGHTSASQGEQDAALAAAQAGEALGDFNNAVAGAQGVLDQANENFGQVVVAANQVSEAHGALNSAADHAMSAMNAVATNGHPAMTEALLALDALEQALAGIVAQYGNFQNVASGQPTGAEVAAFQSQGAAALQALLAAVANAQNAANNAASGAGSAADAADAASAVQALALQLADRFGLDMNGALAAAAQAYAEALAAGGASANAQQSAQQAQALALLAHADAIGNIASQIEALMSQTNNLSAAALAELESAQGTYVAVNEYGASVFADLTEGEAGGAIGLMQGANQDMQSLQEMASTSTAYVAALDGAETAAKGAETAEIGARQERKVAENRADYAQKSFQEARTAARNEDYRSAANWASVAAMRAGQSDNAADRSYGYAQEAVNQYGIAQQHGATAESLQAIINQYGANSAQYQAAAAAYNADVQGANASVQDIAARADFYSDVAQMLAGRANTNPALADAMRAGDANAQVMAIAAQLAESAQSAAQLEQTARSNAERMFYRSARQYVERAGAAANRALNESRKARDAAERADQYANQAAQQANKRSAHSGNAD